MSRFDEDRVQFLLALLGLTDRTEQGHVRRGLARAHMAEGRYADMVHHCHVAGQLYRADGNDHGYAKSLNEAEYAYAHLGDHITALANSTAALAIFERLDDRHGQAATLQSIGYTHLRLGDHRVAIGFFDRALPLCREVGDRHGEAETLSHLGDAWQAAADGATAVRHWHAAETILAGLGHPGAEEVRRKLAASAPPG